MRQIGDQHGGAVVSIAGRPAQSRFLARDEPDQSLESVLLGLDVRVVSGGASVAAGV